MKKISISILLLALVSTVLPVSGAIDLENLTDLAKQGDARSQVQLGKLYKRGRSVQQDYKKAFFWFEKAAQQGDAEGQRPLGVLYEMGYGVPVDLKQAAHWYQKAAEQGLPRAQVNLGILYEAGHGVTQNYHKARSWYIKAADQGYSRAVNQLGKLYEKGLGVEKDIYQAISLYRKGAEAKYSKAMMNLGRVYEHGQAGLPPDLEAATLWYKKAVEVGYGTANLDLNRVKARLTKETEELKISDAPQEEDEEPVGLISKDSDQKQLESAESPPKIKEIFPPKTKIAATPTIAIDPKVEVPLLAPPLPLKTNAPVKLTTGEKSEEVALPGKPAIKDFEQPITTPPQKATQPTGSTKTSLSSLSFAVMIIVGNLTLVWLFWSFMLKQRGKQIRVNASSVLISDLEVDIKGIRNRVEELRDTIIEGEN